MPELPEAETIARGLRALVSGRVIEDAEVLHADVLTVSTGSFRGCVSGRSIDAIERRGKKVVFQLDGGLILLVNLGMTGRLIPMLPGGPAPAFLPTHPAIRFNLDGGGTLVFDDIRRFGTVECLSLRGWNQRSRALGPEPLGGAFTARRLLKDMKRSRAPIRSWLLDQRKVAGVGNIYACEALWRARVHPRRAAGTLELLEARRLHRAIRAVLQAAIAARGTTLRDYRTADGQAGTFAYALAAYGREGSPCLRCTTTIERVVFANRSAFFCPRCQPDPSGC